MSIPKEVPEKLLPYIPIILDFAVDELRARREYQRAQQDLLEDQHRAEMQRKLDEAYAQRPVSKTAAESIKELDTNKLSTLNVPNDHVAYLLESSSSLIDKQKLASYIDESMVEMMYNVIHGGDIKVMHLFVIYYALTGKVFTDCHAVDQIDRHLSVVSLANIISNPTEEEVVLAIKMLCDVETYDMIDMFRFGIAANVIHKDITENVDYRNAVIEYVRSQGVEEDKIESIIEDMKNSVPKRLLDDTTDIYELVYKFAPAYLREV